MKKYISLFPILLLLFFNHCSNDLEENITTELNNNSDNSNSQNASTNDSFDHKEMLTNWADKIIIPSIINFENSLTQLQEAANIFLNNPTTENLLSLKEIWLGSYLKWQYVEMFDIGIAEEIYFKNRMNLYPVDIYKVENNISYISTAGGAFLEFVEGKKLPAIEILEKKCQS